MTRKRTNVVPFERPAAYWAGKARKHYTPSQLPDAARLLRKALEKSGDVSLALELSQIYSAMECYTAAERCLIRCFARTGMTGSLCYAIGCCALNRGDESLAEQALDQSLRLEPDGYYAERAQEMLENYPWHWDAPVPRCARSRLLCQRSIWERDEKKALALAKKAWEKGRCPRTAMRLGTLLPPREAAPLFRFAAKRQPLDPVARLYWAEALARTGRLPQAKALLLSARKLCRTITDGEMYCETAWRVGWPRQALRFAQDKLRLSPGSADYLRLKYLSLKRMPGKEDLAGRTLEALLEADPDDVSALVYRRHPEQMDLDPNRGALLSALGSFVCAMPERLPRGRFNRILHLMVMTLNGFVSAETVLMMLRPIWHRLTIAEQRSWDDWEDRCVPTALALYLLCSVGKTRKALELLELSPKKKRVKRLLRRFISLSAGKEGDYHALHQL